MKTSPSSKRQTHNTMLGSNTFRAHTALPYLVCPCGVDIGAQFEKYKVLKSEGYGHIEALQHIGITKQCCTMFTMRPGLVIQKPTQRETDEQRALLNNWLSKDIGFANVNRSSPGSEGSREHASAIPNGIALALNEDTIDEDDFVDRLLAGMDRESIQQPADQLQLLPNAAGQSSDGIPQITSSLSSSPEASGSKEYVRAPKKKRKAIRRKRITRMKQ